MSNCIVKSYVSIKKMIEKDNIALIKSFKMLSHMMKIAITISCCLKAESTGDYSPASKYHGIKTYNDLQHSSFSFPNPKILQAEYLTYCM